MGFRIQALFLLFVGLVDAAGCNSTGADVVEPAPIEASSQPASASALEDSNSPHTPDLADAGQSTPEAAQFTPPFPERLDPFEPPKRDNVAVRTDEDHGATVELKGFINVDEPRVVLSIDGVISLVPEGGEKYGVQVRSIQPPNAVLQRGRDRWTATLE